MELAGEWLVEYQSELSDTVEKSGAGLFVFVECEVPGTDFGPSANSLQVDLIRDIASSLSSAGAKRKGLNFVQWSRGREKGPVRSGAPVHWCLFVTVGDSFPVARLTRC